MAYIGNGGDVILPPATKTGPEQRMKMEFPQPDELRLAEKVWRRQGAAPDQDHLIMGEWVRNWDADGQKLEPHYLFSADKAVLVMAIRTSHGKYSIQGTTIRLEIPDSSPIEGKFQIEGDVLTVPGAKGAQDRLQRY